MVSLELTLGERLRVERTRRHMRIDHTAAAVQELLPPSMSMSRELLRRIEAGLIPEDKVNPMHLAALAKIYKMRLRELHPPAVDDARVIGALAKASSRCIALAA